MTTTDQRVARWAAILFDLDGTLADTIDLILRSYRHTMRAHLGVERPDAEWLATMGTPLRDQLRAFGRDDAECAAMLATYTAFQGERHDTSVGAYAGVVDVVRALCDAGIPLGIVTSKRRTLALRTLACCGLDGCFHVVIGPDEATRSKPHPEPVRAALAALGSPQVERVLFVGDSPYDIRAGRAAGVATAAALWGSLAHEELLAARPDYTLSDIRTLLSLQPPSGW